MKIKPRSHVSFVMQNAYVIIVYGEQKREHYFSASLFMFLIIRFHQYTLIPEHIRMAYS